jgi:ketosteroid isomerase-like protein
LVRKPTDVPPPSNALKRYGSPEEEGTYKATGKSMRAVFAHLYELKDGKIVRMTQYVDSVPVQEVLTI